MLNLQIQVRDELVRMVRIARVAAVGWVGGGWVRRPQRLDLGRRAAVGGPDRRVGAGNVAVADAVKARYSQIAIVRLLRLVEIARCVREQRGG